MTLEELQKQMQDLQKNFTEKLDLQTKSFQVQLDAAKKDGEQWKTVAQAAEEKAREFAEQAKKAKEAEAKAFAEAKKAELAAFFAQVKKEGKITPAMEEIALKLAESMTSETVVATFEKSDGSKTTHTQLSLFKAFISALGKTRVFAEQTPGNGARSTASPRAVAGANAGEEGFAKVIFGGTLKELPLADGDLHARAVQFQDEARTSGRTMSYEAALIEASKEAKLQS